MSDHHHHHRRQNEFSPDAGRMSVQPEDVVLKVGHFALCHVCVCVRDIQLIFQAANVRNALKPLFAN